MSQDYPERQAVTTWERDGLRFSIVEVTWPGHAHYNGYVRFAERPLAHEGYDDFGVWIPVHGGITYAEAAADGSYVYGFDCGHSGDDDDPKMRDIEWIAGECWNLARAIGIGRAFEPTYYEAEDDEARAGVIERYHDACRQAGIAYDVRDNFGGMIKVLFGSL